MFNDFWRRAGVDKPLAGKSIGAMGLKLRKLSLVLTAAVIWTAAFVGGAAFHNHALLPCTPGERCNDHEAPSGSHGGGAPAGHRDDCAACQFHAAASIEPGAAWEPLPLLPASFATLPVTPAPSAPSAVLISTRAPPGAST